MGKSLHCISIKPAENGHTTEAHWSDDSGGMGPALASSNSEKPYVTKGRDELHAHLDDLLDQHEGKKTKKPSRADAT
jgi:hypothetical protein